MKLHTFLFRLVRYKWGLFTLNMIFGGIINWLLVLAPGLIIEYFFAAINPGAPVNNEPLSLIALLVASQLARSFIVLGSSHLNITFHLYQFALINGNLFRRILKRPGAQALPHSSGEAVSRFRGDTTQIIYFLISGGIIDFSGMLVFSIVALGIMLGINWLITMIVFVPLIVVTIVARQSSSRIGLYRKQSQMATGEVTSYIAEMFGAVGAIQVADAQESVLKQYAEINNKRRVHSLKDRLFTQFNSSISLNIANLGTGIILLLAVHEINSGNFTVGDLALFMYLLTEFSNITRRFGETIAKYKQAGISLERLAELLQGDPLEELVHEVSTSRRGEFPSLSSDSNALAPPLENKRTAFTGLTIKNLTYFYPDSSRGIENISFTLNPGTFTVITGRLGSGKTTLLRTILGLLPAQSGEWWWNGELIVDPATFFVPPNTAYTPQVPRLFSDSLAENILLGLPDAPQKVERVIFSAVFEEDLAEMKEGLATMVGPRGVRLSGGQLQRVAAARMLLREPTLLVFDDISSALDLHTESQLWQRLTDQKDRTYLVVSHRRPALRHAGQIILLKNGKIEALGTLEELLASSTEMQELWLEETVKI